MKIFVSRRSKRWQIKVKKRKTNERINEMIMIMKRTGEIGERNVNFR